MINECAFDPNSGAPLSRDKEYPEWFDRSGVRTVKDDGLAFDSDREGALTNGELVSSAEGILGYFRRRSRAVRGGDPDPALECAAATAIKQLRRATRDEDEGHSIGQSASVRRPHADPSVRESSAPRPRRGLTARLPDGPLLRLPPYARPV